MDDRDGTGWVSTMTAGRTSPEIDSVPAARVIPDQALPGARSSGTAATEFGRVWGELSATRNLDRETLQAALARIDRADRPAFLFDVAGNLRPHSGVLASVILAVWAESGHPGDSVDREGWVWLFAHAGVTRHGGRFAVDDGVADGGRLVDRPAEPLRLENPTTIVRGNRVTHLVYDVSR